MTTKDIKLSYSSWSNYLQCPKKYKLRKVEGWSTKAVSSPLFFGSAFDQALNRMLGDHQMGAVRDVKSYCLTFDRYWCKAKITSTDIKLSEHEYLEFKKTDFDSSFLTPKDEERALSQEHLTWLCMRRKGHRMLEVYMKELLPKIKRVISFQKEEILQSTGGDALHGFIDLIAELQDGKTYIIDNKTSAKKYTEAQAQISPQLMNYCNFTGIKDVAFFVVTKTKNPEAQIIYGKPTENSKDLMMTSMEEVVHAIKAEVFPPNVNACFGQYGKCEYYDLCHKKDTSSLYKKK